MLGKEYVISPTLGLFCCPLPSRSALRLSVGGRMKGPAEAKPTNESRELAKGQDDRTGHLGTSLGVDHVAHPSTVCLSPRLCPRTGFPPPSIS